MPKNVENELNTIRSKRDDRILYLNDRYKIKSPKYPERPEGMSFEDFQNSEEYLDYKRLSNIANLRDRRILTLSNATKTQANKEASRVLFNNGIDVVQYRNNNPKETSNISYFLTDPSVIYLPKDYNIKGGHLFGAGILGGILNTNNE